MVARPDTAPAPDTADDEPVEPQCPADPLGHSWTGVTPLALANGKVPRCKCGEPYSPVPAG